MSIISESAEDRVAVQEWCNKTLNVANCIAGGGDLTINPQEVTEWYADSSSCVFIKDQDGRMLFCNDRFLDTFSCLESSPVGLCSTRFLPSDLHVISECSDRIIAERSQRMDVEYTLQESDGTSSRWSTFKLPILNKDGAFNGLLGVSRRISPRRPELDENGLARLSRVVWNLRDEEQQVIRLICGGELNKNIARKLNVSVRTVENRRRRILEKLEIDSIAELIKTIVRLEDAGRIRLGV